MHGMSAVLKAQSLYSKFAHWCADWDGDSALRVSFSACLFTEHYFLAKQY